MVSRSLAVEVGLLLPLRQTILRVRHLMKQSSESPKLPAKVSKGGWMHLLRQPDLVHGADDAYQNHTLRTIHMAGQGHHTNISYRLKSLAIVTCSSLVFIREFP